MRHLNPRPDLIEDMEIEEIVDTLNMKLDRWYDLFAWLDENCAPDLATK